MPCPGSFFLLVVAASEGGCFFQMMHLTANRVEVGPVCEARLLPPGTYVAQIQCNTKLCRTPARSISLRAAARYGRVDIDDLVGELNAAVRAERQPPAEDREPV